jgi:hypothetical protein
VPTNALLDGTGHLAAGSEVPRPDRGYWVFGQERPPPFDLATLRGYASRFFDTKLGFSVEKVGPAPSHDLTFVLVHREGTSGTVPVEVRPATAEDHARAFDVERALAGDHGGGLGSLAARCPRIFVVHEPEGLAVPALLVACILSGTSLGPALAIDGSALFGVRSGRARLEALLAQRST